MLEAGADPLQRDNYGRTSTDVASSEQLRQQLRRAAGTRKTGSTGPVALQTADDVAVATGEVGVGRETHAQTESVRDRETHAQRESERDIEKERHTVGNAGGWAATAVGGGIGRLHRQIEGPTRAVRYCDFDVVDAADMDNVRFRR